ncbi:MAG: hypothetical protein KF819_38530 [Labilithrix sp.]|nr:hypothetical protein [Labilithrix sp.]
MHGYYPQPPPQKTGMSALTIVLIIVVVALVLGGGGCLLCIGIAASVSDTDHADGAAPVAQGTLVRDSFAIDLETRFRNQGVPATTVLCPASRPARGDFQCELTVGADRATVQVRDTGSGFAFDVPDTAFLDGAKLSASFQTQIASKIDARLRVPCFTGTLMKKVGSQFSCEVVVGATATGTVVVSVDDAKGSVRMDYTGARAPAPAVTPAAKPVAAGPRVVDFVCPPGQAPGGAVRAGCLCGSDIIGTACGAPGNFTDVTATARGCRFVCQ